MYIILYYIKKKKKEKKRIHTHTHRRRPHCARARETVAQFEYRYAVAMGLVVPAFVCVHDDDEMSRYRVRQISKKNRGRVEREN